MSLQNSTTDTVLFQFGDAQLSQRDFADALASLGIALGDVCLVHSDMGVFGLPRILNRAELLEAMTMAFLDAVGPNGTVVFPTFTYSYCNAETFDIDRSATKMGALNEYFRKRANVRRSKHPLFSVAAWGKHRDPITNVGDDSFGRESVFGRLHELHGKLIFLGAPFQACTFVHYIEQTLGVQYRYLKEFAGTRIENNVAAPSRCTFYVRQLDSNVTTDLTRLERELTAQGALRLTTLGGGTIQVVDAAALFDIGTELLRQDIFAFLGESPVLEGVECAK